MNGHVYRRGKRWGYVFEAGVNPATGKRQRRHKSGFETQRAAKEAMREAMAAFDAGITAPGEVPTLGAYLDEWLAGRRAALRPSTWDSYKDVLKGRVVPRHTARSGSTS